MKRNMDFTHFFGMFGTKVFKKQTKISDVPYANFDQPIFLLRTPWKSFKFKNSNQRIFFNLQK